jgi:hypothetical protein
LQLELGIARTQSAFHSQAPARAHVFHRVQPESNGVVWTQLLIFSMSILTILVVIIVVGVLLWGAESLPMSAPIRRILQVVVVGALVIWLLQALGLMGDLRSLRIR